MDDYQIKLFQSKNTDDWGTPKQLFKEWDKEFKFTFDPCPLFSLIDYLNKPWSGRVFCNPPYSKITEFLKKGILELKAGRIELVVYLIFANTDTKFFHNLIKDKAQIRFIKGRVTFVGWDALGNIIKNSAMRPSMLAIYKDPLF